MIVSITEMKEKAHNSTMLTEFIDRVFEQCSPEWPPELSGLIASARNGSQPMLEALGAKYEEDRDIPRGDRYWWKLHIFRDEWGNNPEPEEKFTLRRSRPLQHRPGKPVTGDELTYDKITGEYDKKWTRTRDYTIDEKGCISVEFQDAVTILNTRGIHYRSRHKLGVTDFREQTETPAKAPNGQELNVWYWQACEAPKEYYDNLPTLKKTGRPRRGISPLEDILAWEKGRSKPKKEAVNQ